MKPYEQYKNSGIDWLGQVPSHWGVKKITHIFRKIGSGTTPTAGMPHYYDNGEINWLQTGDLNDGIINETSKKITPKAIKDFSSLKIYSPNSLVIAMYGATIGKVGLLNIHTTTNQACCVLSDGHNLEIKYVFYFFQAFKDKIVAMAYGGGQPNISQDLIKSLRICIPPLPEQTAIAKFLDEKTARIQTAIGIKNEQIAKLKEYRQALINQTVTKGLKANVAMKNSGVAWLGDVPEHWEVLALKRVITEHSGNGFPIELQGNNGSIPFLKVSDFSLNSNKFVEQWHNSVTQITAKSKKWNVVPKGALVTAKIGEALRKNHRKILLENSIIDNNCLGIEFIKIDHLFGYYLHCAIDFDWFVNEGAVPSLSMGKYRNFKIPLPPLPEQLAIVEFLDEKTAQIDTAIAQYQRQIERLKEYWQSLVNEAVTGKIRVGWAMPTNGAYPPKQID